MDEVEQERRKLEDEVMELERQKQVCHTANAVSHRQGCIRTAVHRRRRGGKPPPPPLTPLPFQCLRLTATILLRRQENLSLKIFGPPLAGTIEGPWEGGGSQPTPPPPPPRLPSNTSLAHRPNSSPHIPPPGHTPRTPPPPPPQPGVDIIVTEIFWLGWGGGGGVLGWR